LPVLHDPTLASPAAPGNRETVTSCEWS
jgi:hypothetical protein